MLDIVLLGGSGLLGKALMHDLAAFGILHCPSHTELDVTDPTALSAYLAKITPDIIVNAVGYTQVDAAEQFNKPSDVPSFEPMNSTTAEHNICWRLNAELPKQLAQYAAAHQSYLVHFSSDYVYGNTDIQCAQQHVDASYDVLAQQTDLSSSPALSAQKQPLDNHSLLRLPMPRYLPRAETEPTQPLQYYGRCKLAGDDFILASGCRALIFRTSWLYGAWGRNFLQTLWQRYQGGEREFRVVADQFGAPTSVHFLAEHVAMVLEQVLESSPEQAQALFGIYHLCADGATSWYDFACAIFQQAYDYAMIHEMPTIHAIQSTQLCLPAARPANSMLALGKIRTKFKLSITPWQIQLDETLQLMKMQH